MVLLHLIKLGIIACSLNSSPSDERVIDILHYKFELQLSDRHDTIYGSATISMKFLRETNQFDLDLYAPDGNGKGMKLQLVRGQNVRGTVLKTPDHFTVMLAGSRKSGDTATYTILYKGIPADGLIISTNKYGKRTFFADNWPTRARHWLPVVDDPADKASVEFMITAPLHYQVVANGIQLEETNTDSENKFTHWYESKPTATKVMVIGVADFAVQLAGIVDNIPVTSWVYPQDRNKGFYDYALAAEILPYFIKNIGPYPYDKLANVQSKTRFGGLENANTIFYAESSVTGMRTSEETIAHEIVHQWFGNTATEKTFAHLWLSEGFATYLTILYCENKYGRERSRKMLMEDREQVNAFHRNSPRPVVDKQVTDYMSLLNANSYQKGGWILHMLRRSVGDELFWKIIQQYYQQYKDSNADTDDFAAIVKKVTGKDHSGFFQQWAYSPTQPLLNLGWKYDQSKKMIILNADQTNTYNAFEFPLEVRFEWPDGKHEIKSFNITEKNHAFNIPAVTAPSKMTADPNVSLLLETTVKPL